MSERSVGRNRRPRHRGGNGEQHRTGDHDRQHLVGQCRHHQRTDDHSGDTTQQGESDLSVFDVGAVDPRHRERERQDAQHDGHRNEVGVGEGQDRGRDHPDTDADRRLHRRSDVHGEHARQGHTDRETEHQRSFIRLGCGRCGIDRPLVFRIAPGHVLADVRPRTAPEAGEIGGDLDRSISRRQQMQPDRNAAGSRMLDHAEQILHAH